MSRNLRERNVSSSGGFEGGNIYIMIGAGAGAEGCGDLRWGRDEDTIWRLWVWV